MSRGSAEISNLLNCASVLPSLESRKFTGREILPSAEKFTDTLS
jgi:hypothetical protein